MLVRIWGSRGSLPVAMNTRTLREKMARALVAAGGRKFESEDAAREFIAQLDFSVSHTFGGNSPCVQIEAGAGEYVLCDLGSGARVFGNHVLATDGAAKKNTYHIFMSHLHWDHIMGFPFFTPAYLPGNRIRIYGCHVELERAFRRQHAAPSFPVEFDQLGADIEFIVLQPGQPCEVGAMTVRTMLQQHSGDSYGYRFEHGGKSLVYTTDSEHRPEDFAQSEAFIAFFHRADLVIFDAMYSLADAVSVKADWGHSSNIVGVELCQAAQVKRLCLFHHEPVYSDERILSVWRDTQRLEELTRAGAPLEVYAAYDGMEIQL